MDNLKYTHLKKASKSKALGSKENAWNIDNYRDGFKYFYDLYGHWPNAHEIDDFKYLSSSRQIQRSFGGLAKLRKQLDLPCSENYTKGQIRSDVAKNTWDRAVKYEKEFYQYLIDRIPEVRVHEHKIIRPGNVQSDFFVYTSNNDGIVIDLFYAKNVKTAMNVINIKLKRYIQLPFLVLLIIVDKDIITQEQIDNKLKNKKNNIPNHIKVLTEKTLKDNFEKFIEFGKNTLCCPYSDTQG